MKTIKPFIDQDEKSTLFIVATPIGNLNDISKRAIATLNEVDFIACEDQRNTRKLLSALEIKGKTLITYHNHNEKNISNLIIEYLKSGKNIALVSDAGMPTISDPGYRVVNLVKEHDFNLTVIPGPCALVDAMAASGFYHKFIFYGFLTPKVNKRKTELKKLSGMPFSLIFYCSPYKLEKTLIDISEIFPNQQVLVAKELTKIYETLSYGTASEIIESLPPKIKGEYVIIIDNYN